MDTFDSQSIEKELKENQERFKALLEAAFEGIMIHERGKILDLNENFAAMFGYTARELMGTDGFKLVSPRYRTMVKEKAQSSKEETYELEGIRRDGSIFPAEASVKMIPYKGRLVRTVAARDITERKETEKFLREAHQQLEQKVQERTAELSKLNQSLKREVTRRKEIEINLQKSRKRIKAQLAELDHHYETAPIGLCLMDSQLRYIRINRHLADLNGRSIEDHMGRSLGEMVSPWSKKILPIYKKVINSGQPRLNLEVQGVISENPEKEIWILISCFPLKSKDGAVQAISTVVQDITARKRMEQDLQESEEKYRSIFSEAKDGIVLIDIKNGCIVDCNPEFERQSGRDIHHLRKMPIWELLPCGEIQKAKKVFFEIRKKDYGESSFFHFQKPDGPIVPIEFTSKRINILGRQYHQSISRDISERKKAKKNLELFRNLIDQFNDALFVIDPLTGQFVDTNQKACTSLGYTRAELLKRGVMDIETMPSYRILWSESVKKVKAKGGMVAIGEHLRKDGTTFPVEVSIQYIEQEQKGYIVAVARDITQRKQAEEALRKSEAKYRHLVENLKEEYFFYSHDVHGIVDYISPSVKNVVGYEQEEMLMHYSKCMTDNPINQKVDELTQQTIQGKKVPPYEIEMRHKDGSSRAIELTENAVFDHNGKVIAVEGIAKDITKIRKAQQILKDSESKLRTQKIFLEQKNIALKEVLEQIEIEKKQIKENIVVNAARILDPILKEFEAKGTVLDSKCIHLVRNNIEQLTSRFGSRIIQKLYDLTPKEVKICTMIKDCLNSREIAKILDVSPLTVETHRKNIRKKLGISNQEINLSTYLRNIAIDSES